MDCSTPGFPFLHHLPELAKFMSIDVSDATQPYLILCHPLFLLSSIFPSIRVFPSEPVPCISWPEYWSFSFSISPSKEYSELIYFMIDWFDILAIQVALNSGLQNHSLKVSILWLSAFFMFQLSYPYMTTEKTIALTIWKFVHFTLLPYLPWPLIYKGNTSRSW